MHVFRDTASIQEAPQPLPALAPLIAAVIGITPSELLSVIERKLPNNYDPFVAATGLR